MARIVSVINYKGGVGKTTLTANIAAQLAQQGKRVLAIDLDPQTNLSFSFMSVDKWKAEYQYERTIKAWYDAIIDRDQITHLSELIVHPSEVEHIPLDLICSHLGLINVDLELAAMLSAHSPRKHRNQFLKVYSLLANGLKSIRDQYDLIVIDCPPNFNIVTKNALVASDYFIIPAKPDYLSTIGIEELIKHVGDLVSQYNRYIAEEECEYSAIAPKLLGIAFTMLSFRDGKPISAQQQYIEEVKRMKLPIFDCVTRENKTLYASASQYGEPVVLQKVSGTTQLTVKQELELFADEFAKRAAIS